MLVTMPNVLCKFHATVCRRYSPFLVRCCTRSRLVRRPTCTGLVDIRLLSASVSDTDEQTIVSARRRYLEVWAGIRRGELSKSAPAGESSGYGFLVLCFCHVYSWYNGCTCRHLTTRSNSHFEDELYLIVLCPHILVVDIIPPYSGIQVRYREANLYDGRST